MAGTKVVYTYDTFWELSDISWASRWDAYLKMPGGRVHWFSILNSLMVVLVMSSIVAMIMLRTIRRDLARYEGLLGDTGDLYFQVKVIALCAALSRYMATKALMMPWKFWMPSFLIALFYMLKLTSMSLFVCIF